MRDQNEGGQKIFMDPNANPVPRFKRETNNMPPNATGPKGIPTD